MVERFVKRCACSSILGALAYPVKPQIFFKPETLVVPANPHATYSPANHLLTDG